MMMVGSVLLSLVNNLVRTANKAVSAASDGGTVTLRSKRSSIGRGGLSRAGACLVDSADLRFGCLLFGFLLEVVDVS